MSKTVRNLAIIAGVFLPLTASASIWSWPWNWPDGFGGSFIAQIQRPAQHLPKLGGDSNAVSVSGLSAGGFMAVQLHVAYSRSLIGVGVLSGGPWMCAGGDVFRAQGECMETPKDINVTSLVSLAKKAAAVRAIDGLSNLSTTRAYLLNSKIDDVVREPMNAKIADFYSNFIPSSQVKSETSIASAHGMPTLDYGRACDDFGPPYLNKCGFDAAGEVLKFIYSARASQMKRATAVSSSLHAFDQTEFGSEIALMGPRGWVYIPQACAQSGSKCPVHVVLHGCLQTPAHIKNTFAVHAGYNEWAEGSGLIILYPQAETSLMNPKGCFDWWGYTGDDYATKNGAQMKVIKAMMDRLTDL